MIKRKKIYLRVPISSRLSEKKCRGNSRAFQAMKLIRNGDFSIFPFRINSSIFFLDLMKEVREKCQGNFPIQKKEKKNCRRIKFNERKCSSFLFRIFLTRKLNENSSLGNIIIVGTGDIGRRRLHAIRWKRAFPRKLVLSMRDVTSDWRPIQKE